MALQSKMSSAATSPPRQAYAVQETTLQCEVTLRSEVRISQSVNYSAQISSPPPVKYNSIYSTSIKFLELRYVALKSGQIFFKIVPENN